ncbi:single-stranded DNA-binding protein [Corynebacterium simulans]|uniref:Single-stranded DNA-binding protein n=1 Tax=Corynebacterium simulans TaxID=146827 RepID=A0ABR5VBI5_9CORY|nr:single-stranded DNA-binding protein [Corynebacterium simulans]KXU18595.1 single-stranded DNA-binding protein [Corynebacterium simulans]
MAISITLSGNLIKDPEQRFTPNGKSVVSFTVAHNIRQYNQQSQQWEDGEPIFMDVDFWGKKGENFLHDYTQNGKRPVVVLGSLKQDRWVDKSTDDKRSKYKVNADEVSFIPRGQGGGGQQPNQAQQQWNSAAQQGQTATSGAWSQPPAPAGQDQTPPF